MNPDDKLPYVFDTDEALQLMDFLLDEARKDCESEQLKPVAICIVDARGDELCAVRMGGATQLNVKAAFNKANTAVLYKRNTIEFHHKWDGDSWVPTDENWSVLDVLSAQTSNPDHLCTWGGGALVISPDGHILGAVAISGRTQEQDHELASYRPEMA